MLRFPFRWNIFALNRGSQVIFPGGTFQPSAVEGK
jgi:hypothetical protein